MYLVPLISTNDIWYVLWNIFHTDWTIYFSFVILLYFTFLFIFFARTLMIFRFTLFTVNITCTFDPIYVFCWFTIFILMTNTFMLFWFTILVCIACTFMYLWMAFVYSQYTTTFMHIGFTLFMIIHITNTSMWKSFARLYIRTITYTIMMIWFAFIDTI